MDDKFMNYALKEAQKAYNKMDVPVGCVIVYNGKIIARGYNKREKDQNVIKHAEIEAIDKACKALKSWRLNDCTIYTTLFPCPMCASAIQQSRISKLVYLNNTNNKALNDISLNILFNENLNHRVKIDKIFLENSIIDDFFEKIRKEK
ncbi:MAG: nucleoside deaminase [Bacilli bacterium]|jgi:tRNA(adenine34) deaminase|nr:nucleoside deaminase [Bacilli bacterium]